MKLPRALCLCLTASCVALWGGSALAQTTCLTTFANPTGAAVSGFTPATPNSALIDNGNGTITHTTTGLMWKKCPEGRTYSVSTGTCSGSTGSYTWQAALKRATTDSTANKSDWRLPTRMELLSLIETACGAPMINVARFPNVGSSDNYWTGSHTGSNAPDSAWAVRFNNGTSLIWLKEDVARARLVRIDDTNPAMADDVYRATSAPTEPAAFSFASAIAEPGATATSNIVTLSGMTASRAIKIYGGNGAYRINGGSWTSADGTIANGNTLQLRIVAPNLTPSSTSTTVNVNGRTATFLVNTGTPPPDKDPDPFTFVDQTGVFPGAPITSAAISVSGINQPTPISISGDGTSQYSINGGSYTSVAGTVNNGDNVTVQHTASSGFLQTVNTTLTIGETGTTKSDTFSSTTAARDISPNAFSFTDQTNVALNTLIESNAITVSSINDAVSISVSGTANRESAYQIDGGSWVNTGGTVTNGQSVKVRHRSNTGYTAIVDTTLTIGDKSDTFTTTTAALDTTPDDYSFTTQTGVTRSSTVTSNPVTITGINGPASIALVAPVGTSQFQIRQADDSTIVTDWTNATSGVTIISGQIVRVKHNASGSYSTDTVTTLTIGGVQRSFTSTTEAAPNDTTPDAFSFPPKTGVLISSDQISDAATITGVTPATNIPVTIKAGSVAGSTFEINGSGSWVTTGNIQLNQTIKARHSASGSFSTPVTTTLVIGGVEGSFTSTTEAQDTTPDAFTFTDLTGVQFSTPTVSNAITISGINSPATVSALTTGHAYEVNGSGTWITTTGGTVSNGNTVKVQHTSSASPNTTVNTVLTIGGVTDTFSTTTLNQDLVPDAFTFTDQTNVSPGAALTSNTITVSGITGPTSISVTGGEYQIGTGTWTSAAGTVSNGNTVKVRHTASSDCPSTVDTTLTIGGVSDTFSSTTVTTAPPNPVLTFATVNNASRDATITSELKTVSGICNNSTITRGGHTSGTYSVNGGTYGTTGTISPGQTLRLRLTMCGTSGCTRSISVTIGGATTTWLCDEN